jgi:hypothetical protein
MPPAKFRDSDGKAIHFPKARAAREAMRERAQELIDFLLKNAQEASANGDYKAANEAIIFALKHMPADEDGTTVLDPDVSKKGGGESGSGGPTIQIGFALGGVSPGPKALPSVTVTEPGDEDE